MATVVLTDHAWPDVSIEQELLEEAGHQLVAPFGTATAEQVEQVISLSEALVALSRPAREPATIGRIADQVATLLRPAFAGNGGTLDLTVEGEGTTRVAAGAARLLVAAALLAAVDAAGSASGSAGALHCRVKPTSGVELLVEGSFRAPPAVDTEVERMARQLGVAVHGSASSITLTFPA